jgi:hypothetical protein
MISLVLSGPALAQEAGGLQVRDVRLAVGFARHITGDALLGESSGNFSNRPSGPAFDVDFTVRDGRRARLGLVFTLVVHPSGQHKADLSAGARWTWLDRRRVSPFFHATVGVINFWRTGVGGGFDVKLTDRFAIKYQFDVSLLVAEDSEEFFGHLVAVIVRLPASRQ